MSEEIETEVTWAQGKLALDMHIDSPVRVVAVGQFGSIQSEGVLRPSENPGGSEDHAVYALHLAEYEPFPFTLTRNQEAVCTVTDSALMIQYDQAVIRIVWADLSGNE